MILLRRLRVSRLKHLHDVDIWFPRQGSVLIEGQNESGKSTLFEAIYFALYGAPLVTEDSASSLAALVPHGEANAEVELTLLAGETELEIHRSLALGKRVKQDSKAVKHEARLIVRGPEAPKEELNTIAAVNARILQEIHGLDGNALRNSCLMEQQALDRIESLSRDAREDAIARLLGLDTLRRATREFQPTRVDENRLNSLRAQLEVARSQRIAREATSHERESAERRRATEVLREAHARDELSVAQSDLAAEIQQDTARSEELERRVADSGKVTALLARSDEIGRELAQAHGLSEQSATLKTHIAALDGQGNDRLPAAQERLAALSRLQPEFVATQRRVAYLSEATRLTREHAAAKEAVAATTVAVENTQREADTAKAVATRAQAREALERWLRVAEGSGPSEAQTRADQTWAEHGSAQRRYTAAREQTRMWLVLLALAGGFTLVLALLGASSHLLWLVTATGALATALFFALWRRSQIALAAISSELERLERALHGWTPSQGGGRELAAVEAALAPLGMETPADVAAGRRLLVSLGDDLPPVALAQSRANEAATSLESQKAAFRRAELDLEHTDQARLRAEILEGATSEGLDQERLAAEARLRQLQEELTALGVTPSVEAVSAALGAAKAELDGLQQRGDQGQRLADQERDLAARVSQSRGHSAEALVSLITAMLSADIPVAQTPGNLAESDVETLIQTHEAIDAALHARITALDAVAAQAELAALAVQRKGHEERAGSMREESARRIGRIRELLAEQGIVSTGQETVEALSTRWPLLADADLAAANALSERADEAYVDAEHARRSAAEVATRHNLDAEALATLNEEECQREVEETERDLRRRKIAAELADQAFTSIVRQVLPETEAHMRAVLPELTAGRYRDVQLLPDKDANSADLRIRVWDQLAGRYVAKNLFSGGTRDQCSLALRLAFALATLPKELGAIPGFIFLDEPLSSFDAERSQALVYILTQGEIARHFSQVFLISHSQSFDPRSFSYRLNMGGGRVVESTLPREVEAQNLWAAPAAISQAL